MVGGVPRQGGGEQEGDPGLGVEWGGRGSAGGWILPQVVCGRDSNQEEGLWRRMESGGRSGQEGLQTQASVGGVKDRSRGRSLCGVRVEQSGG